MSSSNKLFGAFQLATVLAAMMYASPGLFGFSSPEAHAGFRMDPRTAIEFETSASFSGKSYDLAGVGTRTKAGVVKVYSVGFYAPKKALESLKGKGPRELQAIDSPRVAHLKFAMGVGAEKVATALSAVEGVGDETMTAFNDMLIKGMGGKMNKGESLTLEWDGATTTVAVRGMSIGSVKSKELASGLLELYLGKSSVSPTLKGSIKATLA
eukprot:CAMPEP_0172593046 /NCGR_PEP_ID=MMETSP1068-20121228/12244_1 /TAXON_ID=35684 /ORGANISM="Pseudopedinella elastica, Strain CCMP716" /LENGTH=210 /DNA_ID=CAMNT_0013390413 /DNA_START=35 /DNA_END=667 /DNA_ORIENTATION=-